MNEYSPSDRGGITRRSVLLSAAAAAAGSAVGGGIWAWRQSGRQVEGRRNALIAGEPLALTTDGKLLDTDFQDPFAGGQFLGYLHFASGKGPREYPIGKIAKVGHDARRVIDVASLLMPGSRTTPADEFFIRTQYPDQLKPPADRADWTIPLAGEVKKKRTVPLRELLPQVESHGPVLLECSGNAAELSFGLLSVGEWAGIPFEKIIELAQPTSKAKSVFVNGFDDDSHPSGGNHSKPTCSWIFRLEDLANAKAFLATELNGKPLQKDNGAPIRLIVPGCWGCCEVKWVNQIHFVDSEQPATLQMLEFAGRTLQNGQPERAADYSFPLIDQNAVPVRVEQWRVDEKTAYRVVGITWGAKAQPEKLKIRFHAGRSTRFEPVQFCAVKTANPEYGVWCHHWQPTQPGVYRIQVRVDDESIPSRKLALGNSDRVVVVHEV